MALTKEQLNDLRTTVYEFVETHPRYAASTIKSELSTKWGFPEHAIGSALAIMVRVGLLTIIQGGSPDFGAVHYYPAYIVTPRGEPDVADH